MRTHLGTCHACDAYSIFPAVIELLIIRTPLPHSKQKLHVQHTLSDGATGKHFYDSCIDIMGFFEEFVPVGLQNYGRSLRLQMLCSAFFFSAAWHLIVIFWLLLIFRQGEDYV